MALVVITLHDEDDGVDVKFVFEPLVKDGDNTPAQLYAAQMLRCLSSDVVSAEAE